MAADRNQVEVAKVLLGYKPDINAQDLTGSTALHYACICEHLEFIKLLLNNGASIEIVDNDGNKAGDLFDISTLL